MCSNERVLHINIATVHAPGYGGPLFTDFCSWYMQLIGALPLVQDSLDITNKKSCCFNSKLAEETLTL